MTEATNQPILKPSRPRLKLFGILLLSVFLLSVEGVILTIFSGIGFIDTNPDWMDAATSSAVYAYLISISLVVIWGIVLLFKNQDKNRIRSLNLTAVGAGMLMILLNVIIGAISLNYAAAPPSSEVSHMNSVAKVLALKDTVVLSSDNKPIGIHLEYAIQIPQNAPAGADRWSPSIVGTVTDNSGNNNINTLSKDLYATQDSSNTMLGTIASDQSGTVIAYGSYDLFPDGSLVEGKDAQGNINYCFNTSDNNLTLVGGIYGPSETRYAPINNVIDFYSSVKQNVVNLSSTLLVYLKSDVSKAHGLNAVTNNSYDVKSFFETVAQGVACGYFKSASKL